MKRIPTNPAGAISREDVMDSFSLLGIVSSETGSYVQAVTELIDYIVQPTRTISMHDAHTLLQDMILRQRSLVRSVYTLHSHALQSVDDLRAVHWEVFKRHPNESAAGGKQPGAGNLETLSRAHNDMYVSLEEELSRATKIIDKLRQEPQGGDPISGHAST